MGSVLCQGYCGGYHPLSDMRRVGEYGERFCPECYGELMYSRYYTDG